MLNEAFDSGIQAVIDCIPTGGGKTVCFSDFALDKIREGFPTMVVCNRKELIAQAKKKMNEFGLFPTLIVPGYKDTVSSLYLASIDTLRNKKLPEIKYLIIDEAHIRAFDPLVLYYKARGVKIIGATATPIRYGKKLMEEYPSYTGQLGNVYDKIIVPTTITELLQNEHLVPAITYGLDLDLSDVKMKGEDYDQEALANKVGNIINYKCTIETYRKHADNTKVLCFNVNVKDSIQMTQACREAGISSAHVDGTSKDRDNIFEDFKAGRITWLNNCEVATTGYDEETIETIITRRPTLSLSLWLQMAGRGGRTSTKIVKPYFTLIDMGGNVYTHGLWQQEREWSLDIVHKSKKKGVAPITMCKDCEALFPLSAVACPYCGLLNEKKKAHELEMREAQFKIMEMNSVPKELSIPLNKMTVPQLEEYRELKNYKLGWIVRILVTRGREALTEYAALKNYSNTWIDKQLEFLDGEKDVAKIRVLSFIKHNHHVDEKAIEEFSIKKLKAYYSKAELETAIQKIMKITSDYRAGLIKIEL